MKRPLRNNDAAGLIYLCSVRCFFKMLCVAEVPQRAVVRVANRGYD